jgi:hypothetical protein
MATTHLDYMKERESFETGSLVFTWYEPNPEEPPDCRLCYRDGTGHYISGIAGSFDRDRSEEEPSDQLLLLSDRRGVILVLAGRNREQAAELMQRLREAACSAGETDRHFQGRAAPGGTITDGRA